LYRKVHYVHGADSLNPEQLKDTWGEEVPKITVSSYLDELIQRYCNQKAIEVVANGVDIKEFYPTIALENKDGVGTIFGSNVHKDPLTVLAGLKLLEQQCPAVEQYIFGSSRRPAEIQRCRYVRLPTVEKAREIYSRCKVWFMGSREEGFAVPILEAMACGCAVVATNCGGPSDIITDGENGFLVKTGDAAGLVNRIRLLLENEELRRKFVLKSQETVKKFCWENSVDKLEGALMSLWDLAAMGKR
jgi:glycosyltransferase involved in cell wall biosynthesis